MSQIFQPDRQRPVSGAIIVASNGVRVRWTNIEHFELESTPEEAQSMVMEFREFRTRVQLENLLRG